MNLRPIRFVHRGRTVELAEVPPTRSLLDWLREDAHCTGTKEGCAEGDCGACTVVLGRATECGLQLEPANACLRFLPTVDGLAVFTVEDLQGLAGGALHPVQQAMVDHHGSQCGFCTPGFVMSLWERYEHHQAAGTRPTRQQLADDLAGNLCRCTGYRPILDAGEAMFAAPAVRLGRDAVLAPLHALSSDPPLAWPGRFHAPRTLDALAALRLARPEARLLAGATDVALWVNKQLRVLPELIYLGEVPELRRIELRDGVLHIGAGASLEAAWRALVAHWPALQELWLRFASPPVRFAGTMGGNVANGSPIGDSAPALIALGASLTLRRGDARRTLPLEDFYVDYMRNRLLDGEFVQAIQLPLPAPGQRLRAYKISKRFDSDISAVCAAFALTLDAGVVQSARLAFGGMAATVRRAPQAEAALTGRPWTEATLQAAMAALAQDFTPLTDLRASAAYRRQVAANLLRRCWLETRPQDPLPSRATRVWPIGVERSVASA